MSGTVTLWAATKESVQVEIRTPSDPTTTPPAFALSAAGATAPGSFTDGAWSGTWDATTGRTLAVSPTLGPTGQAALAISAATTYMLWIKVTLLSEVAVWPVGSIRVP